MLERTLPYLLVRSGTIPQVVSLGNTMLLWKVGFAHAQPARTGACTHALSLAKNFLTHSIQENVPSLKKEKKSDRPQPLSPRGQKPLKI